VVHRAPGYVAAGAFWHCGVPFSHLALKILGPATIIFFLGLADDIFGVSAYVKFAVQAGAAVLLFFNGIGSRGSQSLPVILTWAGSWDCL